MAALAAAFAGTVPEMPEVPSMPITGTYVGDKWEYMQVLVPMAQLTEGLNKAGSDGWEAWGVLEMRQMPDTKVVYAGVALKRKKMLIAGATSLTGVRT